MPEPGASSSPPAGAGPSSPPTRPRPLGRRGDSVGRFAAPSCPPPRLAPTLLAVADGPCSDLHLRRSHPDAGSTRGNGEIECRGCRVGAIVVLSTSCPIDNDAKYLEKLARDAVWTEPVSSAVSLLSGKISGKPGRTHLYPSARFTQATVKATLSHRDSLGTRTGNAQKQNTERWEVHQASVVP